MNKGTGFYFKLDTGDKITLVTTLFTLLVWFALKGKKYV